jgi:hypothetical protein
VLLDNGKICCFGYNSDGQLGTGDTVDRGGSVSQVGDLTSFVLLPTGTRAMSMALGEAHTCALLDNGKAYCWGRNTEGQLGIGSTTNVNTGAQMSNSLQAVLLPPGSTVLNLVAAYRKTCALLLTAGQKQIVCWGLNQNANMGGGNLGIGNVNAVGSTAGSMGINSVPVQFPTNVATTYATGLGTTACSTACWAGSYFSSSTVCTTCVAGTYTLGTAATACDTCTAGGFSGATACLQCVAGTYNNRTDCAQCATSTYSTGVGVTTCVQCASGFY